MSLTKRRKITLSIAGLVLFFILSVAALFSDFRSQVIGGFGQTVLARSQASPSQPFPDITVAGLSDVQKRIIIISRQEYIKKPVSFDGNVMKYTQGNRQSWCADFASWTLKQAGQPLSNPNSGSWRIPGTATMQEYYQTQNRYQVAGHYVPRVGDIAIYRHDRSHVNIVISVQDKKMTTIGGNETGHLRLNTQSYSFGTQGLSGFGQL